MKGKIKNIIIIIVVAGALIFLYFALFGGGGSENAPLTSSVPAGGLRDFNSALPDLSNSSGLAVGNSFLSLLLSVKSVRLDDSIFSEAAWSSLNDSSVVLNPVSGDEGRSNPFAPIGVDVVGASGQMPPPAGDKTKGSSGTNSNVGLSSSKASSSSDTGIGLPSASGSKTKR